MAKRKNRKTGVKQQQAQTHKIIPRTDRPVCPFCGSMRNNLLRTNDKLTYRHCKNCHNDYTSES